MATVGILGGNSNETAMLFIQLCQEKGQSALVDSYKLTKNNVIPIVSIAENKKIAPKIWILQETTNYALWLDACMGDYLIINADSDLSPFFNALALGLGGSNVITYGFNGRASVTASSVSDEALQVCIQRSFVSLNGSAYEPQEFKAACPSFVSPLSVLGAVTACAVCDILCL